MNVNKRTLRLLSVRVTTSGGLQNFVGDGAVRWDEWVSLTEGRKGSWTDLYFSYSNFGEKNLCAGEGTTKDRREKPHTRFSKIIW